MTIQARLQPQFDALEPSKVREMAWSQFCDLGLPTPRDEHWKYTTLRLLNQLDFAKPDAPSAITLEDIKPMQGSAARLVFIDGQFNADLSDIADHEGLSFAPKTAPSDFAVDASKHRIALLNQALCESGLSIHVSADYNEMLPIEVLCVTTDAAKGAMLTLNHAITLEDNAYANVVFNTLSLGTERVFTNVLHHIELGEKATLEHTIVQRLNQEAIHVEGVHVHQQAESQFKSHVLSLGAKLARFDIQEDYQGVAAKSLSNGIYLVNERQHVDVHLNAEHHVNRCETEQFYRGIVGGKAKAVFNGRVKVDVNGKGAVSQQSNKNMLLTNTAHVDTKPELEIYNDDVKCAHGATVGQLDQDAIFYLEARGIESQAARRMLMEAFVACSLDKIECTVTQAHARAALEGFMQ